MIEATGLTKRYGDVQALDGLTFDVAPGTIFGLLGPNGAGKSTAVKVLTTLARADGGSARVAGHDVTRDAAQVRRSIGVVAQRSGVDVELTGRENVMLQGRLQGLRGRDLAQRADTLLAEFGLADAARRIAKGYSGGMQRRLDIAIGLVHRPKVLFLDEPTTGLDPEVRAAMWTEISRLQREEGLTILLTTHYLEEADRLASALAIVDRGRVVAHGTPDELKANLEGDALHVELGDVCVNGNVTSAIADVFGLREVQVDGRTLHARAADGARAVPAVLAALDSHAIAVASVTVSRPSLDDVYLRFTGRSFAAAEARHAQGARPMTAVADTFSLTIRDLLRLIRQPWFVAIVLVQPIIWLLLFGALFQRVTDIPGFQGGDYKQYLVPGVLVMTAFFSSGWNGMPTIDDINRGVVDRLLVTPVKRMPLIGGRVLQNLVQLVIQSVVIVALALAIGVSFDGGVGWVLVMIVAGRRPARDRLRGAVERARAAHAPGGEPDRRGDVPAAAADVPLDGVHAAGADARLDRHGRHVQPGRLGDPRRPRGRRREPRLGLGGGLLRPAGGLRDRLPAARDARVSRVPGAGVGARAHPCVGYAARALGTSRSFSGASGTSTRLAYSAPPRRASERSGFQYRPYCLRSDGGSRPTVTKLMSSRTAGGPAEPVGAGRSAPRACAPPPSRTGRRRRACRACRRRRRRCPPASRRRPARTAGR